MIYRCQSCKSELRVTFPIQVNTWYYHLEPGPIDFEGIYESWYEICEYYRRSIDGVNYKVEVYAER